MAFDPITEGIAFARDVVNKIFPDAENKEQRAQELARLIGDRDAERDKGQMEVNKVEAASTSLFVAGWRPAVGWVCTVTLAYVWILRDLIGLAFSVHLPVIEMGLMLELLFGLLGLSGMRSWEKWKGVAR